MIFNTNHHEISKGQKWGWGPAIGLKSHGSFVDVVPIHRYYTEVIVFNIHSRKNIYLQIFFTTLSPSAFFYFEHINYENFPIKFTITKRDSDQWIDGNKNETSKKRQQYIKQKYHQSFIWSCTGFYVLREVSTKFLSQSFHMSNAAELNSPNQVLNLGVESNFWFFFFQFFTPSAAIGLVREEKKDTWQATIVPASETRTVFPRANASDPLWHSQSGLTD